MRSMMPNSDSMSAPRLSETDAMNRAASWAELGLPAAAPGPLIGFGPLSSLCSDIHWLPDSIASSMDRTPLRRLFTLRATRSTMDSEGQSFDAATLPLRLRFSVTVPAKREHC